MIKRFKDLGWDGPHQGTGKHPEFMRRGEHVVKLPNPHSGRDIGEGLLKIILAEAGISPEQWLGEGDEVEDEQQIAEQTSQGG